MLSKEERQKNLFKSIVKIAESQEEKELLSGDKYKLIELNLPIEALKEIKKWSKD